MAGFSADDRVISTAHHIIRSLGSSDTDDMLRILSSFDDRFSRFSLSLPRDAACDTPTQPVSDFDSDCAEPGGADLAMPLADRHPPVLQAAQMTIMRWDFGSSESARHTYLWVDQPDEVPGYLDAVDCVQQLIDSLSSEVTNSTADRAQNVLQLAMLRLEEEFRNLLEKHGESVDPEWLLDPVSGASFAVRRETHDNEEAPEEDEEGYDEVARSRSMSEMTIDMLLPYVVSDLCDIATRMVCSGYQTECTQVYVGLRKGVFEESLQRLGLEKFSIEEVQRMPWNVLESEIADWIHTIKIAVGALFPSEKQLCERVFACSPPLSESCFTDIARPAIMQFLNFGEAVAIGRRAPEKLFKILDMYEALRDLLPSIESIFEGAAFASLRSEASAILGRLADAARGTFQEFENAVQRDASKNPVPGGAVHPLARYVMNYMRFLSDYTGTLNQLLRDRVDLKLGASAGPHFHSLPATDQGPLASVALSLMDLLEKNLDGKSKLYKDPALTYLFLMNNVHYIGQKAKDSDVRKLLGDDWIRRHNGKLRQYHNNYRRTAWNKVLACLKDEGINISGGSASGATRNVLKDKFKNFNAAFEENVKIQSSWIVSDSQLQTELRISITEMILPAYRSFLGRFQNYLDARHPERYVKYTAEDLEAHLNDLFEGSSGSMNRRRASFSTAGLAL